MSGRVRSSDFSRVLIKYKSRLKAVLQTSPIFTNGFDWTDGHSLLARRALNLIFGLLADVRVGVLEGAGEVFGSSVATDVAIDAGRIDIERAVNVFFTMSFRSGTAIRRLSKLLPRTMQN